jgi:hypothetical protein
MNFKFQSASMATEWRESVSSVTGRPTRGSPRGGRMSMATQLVSLGALPLMPRQPVSGSSAPFPSLPYLSQALSSPVSSVAASATSLALLAMLLAKQPCPELR